MKYDMCGAATVFGLMEALYSTGYGRRVNGIACLAENILDLEHIGAETYSRHILEKPWRSSVRTPKVECFG